MKYEVEMSEKALKALKKMDKYTAKLITSWIRNNLQNCEDPRRNGKALTANRAGQWI